MELRDNFGVGELTDPTRAALLLFTFFVGLKTCLLANGFHVTGVGQTLVGEECGDSLSNSSSSTLRLFPDNWLAPRVSGEMRGSEEWFSSGNDCSVSAYPLLACSFWSWMNLSFSNEANLATLIISILSDSDLDLNCSDTVSAISKLFSRCSLATKSNARSYRLACNDS